MNRNVMCLAGAQALAGANATVIYATGAIIGNMLAPNPSLATLPISVFVIGMAASTLPVGALVKRHGRRITFLLGNLSGVLVGLIAALALYLHSFNLFCFSMLFGGAYAAVALTFRFAATEYVPAAERPRALSLVLAGGVAAGIIGPQLVSATMSMWSPYDYIITYLAAAVVSVLSACVLAGLKSVQGSHSEASSAHVRPTVNILSQPRLIVAMISGVVSYMLMNFMMTSAPLAMESHGLSRLHANHGIEMHVIAMYLPSFFTGRLITRFGANTVILLGLLLISLAAVTGMSGLSVHHFWWALILLGVGWNFGFLGASALVLNCHTPEEAPRVQSINDFVVFGSMVIGSFVSGSLLNAYGWFVVSALMLPLTLVAIVGVMWLQWSTSSARVAIMQD